MSPKLNADPERMTTSLKINPKLWKKAKLSAVEHDMQLSDLVEKAVEKWVKENK